MKLEAFEMPPELLDDYRRGLRLEWWSIAYLISTVVVLFLVAGSSQAMKTMWMDNTLGLIPPLVILGASKLLFRRPDKWFPYGYHRVVSIATLCASLVLLGVGAWLLIEAVMNLVQTVHPTIGGVVLFDRVIWLGWLMFPALLWTAVPGFFLGRAKIPIARRIHDKALFADSAMNKADWTSAAAAMFGVAGIGWGWWWADAVAAALISFSILHDGLSNLVEVVQNLMDETPKTVERHEVDKLPERIHELLEQFDWIEKARVRMRENGHVFFGEALVVTHEHPDLVHRLNEATAACLKLDWRLYDFHIVPVFELPADGSEQEE